MRRIRYQSGTVELSPRSQGPAVWVYRWRERSPQGKSVRKSRVLGTKLKYRTKALALRSVEGFRLKINQESPTAQEVSFRALVDRFVLEERLYELKDADREIDDPDLLDLQRDDEALAPSTCCGYLSNLNVHILPKWGDYPLTKVRPMLVQPWLKSLDLAPKTKGHIKEVMHRLFEKAMLWELVPFERNPMQLVEIKGISKRRRKPVILTVDQFWALVALIPEPYRTMVIVAACTGLRVSEILALRWLRFSFENLTLMVKHAVVNGRVKRVKTEYSEDELPLDPDFAALLLGWREHCEPSSADWVFPSHINGRCYHASTIQQDYIRPAAEKLGLLHVGWHTFRHTYRSWLDATGAPVGVQQKLMRHADIATTMNAYGNALMESKRDANSKVVQMALPKALKQA